MDAGPDDVRLSTIEQEGPLGAARSVDPELGPITPELVLVDPVLAERVRQLLPDPSERPRARTPVVAATASLPPERPEVAAPPPAPRRKRRWRRAVTLAVLVFAAGAASGGFLGQKDTISSDAILEGRATMPSSSSPAEASRPRSPSHTRRRPTTSTVPRGHEQLVHGSWAANVLGVAARADSAGVTLVWQRPVGSGHVVVLRARGSGRGVVVFRGTRTRYRDASARPCTAYRYTIVNYDRSGHHSTGVPTSVVTNGCA